LALTFADFYLAQKQYEQAIPYLEKGKQLTKNKDFKSRINFILGQIEQSKGNTQKAYLLFKDCLKANPPLVMSFNARLNIALCYDNKTMNSADISKELLRMLKDSKNERNFGRIYFVLAEIAFKDKNENLAVEYLKKSIDVSAQDPERMLSSALRLSEYFYELPNFIEAQKYYEIASKVIDKNNPAYYIVQSRSLNLNELVGHYNSLQENDSLLAIIRMSPAAQEKQAQKLADAYIKKLADAKLNKGTNTNNTAGITGRSNWYFYNDQIKNAGYTEFIRKWGRRELVDFWFLTNKPPLSALRNMNYGFDDEETLTKDTIKEKIVDPKEKEFYLKSMTLLPSKKQSIDSAIEIALFNLGYLYFEKLGEYALAEEALLRLLKDFPNTTYKPSVYESLCRIYKINKNTAAFTKYAQLLANNYAGSEHDQRINDPQYNEKLQANAQKVNNLYESVYHFFEQNASTEALALIAEIENTYPINNFKPQLLYLKAISEGRIQGVSAMTPSLELFLKLYPKHELAERVKSLLDLAQSGVSFAKVEKDIPLAENTTSVPAETTNETPKDTLASAENIIKKNAPQFVLQNNKPQFVIALIAKEKINPDVLKIKISDFNRKFFKKSKLSINLSEFDEKFIQVEITEFKNAQEALIYYQNFSTNDYVFGVVEATDKYIFVINAHNYSLLQSSKNIEAYMTFFKTKYLK
ncbi:MAG: hypothetical protein RR190_02270, partial [Bacteroidales bacterium]